MVVTDQKRMTEHIQGSLVLKESLFMAHSSSHGRNPSEFFCGALSSSRATAEGVLSEGLARSIPLATAWAVRCVTQPPRGEAKRRGRTSPPSQLADEIGPEPPSRSLATTLGAGRSDSWAIGVRLGLHVHHEPFASQVYLREDQFICPILGDFFHSFFTPLPRPLMKWDRRRCKSGPSWGLDS